MTFETHDAAFRDTVRALFEHPGFIRHLGVEFVDCGPGWCTTRLALLQHHFQHTGVVHAGVCTTMADHSGGAAAQTLYPADRMPVTVELAVHLLRGARGTHLECRGEVLKAGRRFTTVESTVHALDGDRRVLVAKLSATMTPHEG